MQCEFCGEVWNLFWQRDLLDQILIGLSLLGLFFSIPAIQLWKSRSIRSQLSSARSQIGHQENEITSLTSEIERWKPSAWITQYESEIENGQLSGAVNILEDGIEQVSTELAKACQIVGEHHGASALIGGLDQSRDAARKYAHAAIFLNPNELGAGNLLDQLNLIDQIEEGHADFSYTQLPSDPIAGTHLLARVLDEERKFLHDGLYDICVALSKRAVQIANHAGLSGQRDGINAHIYLAEATNFAGRYQEAADELSYIIPIAKNILGKNHGVTLYALRIECENTLYRGEPKEVIAKCNSLIDRGQDILGDERFNKTLFVKIKALAVMGKLDEASLNLEKLIPMNERVFGKNHSTTLISQFFKTRILGAVGQIDIALTSIKKLIPKIASAVGPNHPNTLIAKRQAINLLIKKREYEEAYRQSCELLPTYRNCLGEDHNEVQIAMIHHFDAMVGSDHLDNAITELTNEIEKQGSRYGLNARGVVQGRIIRLKAIAKLDQLQDWRNEIIDLAETVQSNLDYYNQNQMDYILDNKFVGEIRAQISIAP